MFNPPSGISIILPTREIQRGIEEALGPVLKDLTRVGIDIRILIEYILDQWIVAEIDQELLLQADVIPEQRITQYAIWDFIMQNEQVEQNAYVKAQGVDRTPLVAAVKAVCAYVFHEIVPMIQSLELTPQALQGLAVVRWMGMDLVVGIRPPR